jgi:rhamnose utilization protein RhaD (predicted bifunctional aldolase and dehydrogenase)
MNTLVRTTAEQVKEYCARIGADPLLVQGAGGNVSWKDGDTLWIKASGTWLAESTTKDIFVPVDLAHLRQAIAKKDFSATPKVVGDSNLRPSIETFLHALMPQHVVVHLHAIEVLAHLVHDNFQADFQSLLDESTPWAVVEYYKPGAALAVEINAVLIQKPTAKVIFLKNQWHF